MALRHGFLYKTIFFIVTVFICLPAYRYIICIMPQRKWSKYATVIYSEAKIKFLHFFTQEFKLRIGIFMGLVFYYIVYHIYYT